MNGMAQQQVEHVFNITAQIENYIEFFSLFLAKETLFAIKFLLKLLRVINSNWKAVDQAANFMALAVSYVKNRFTESLIALLGIILILFFLELIIFYRKVIFKLLKGLVISSLILGAIIYALNEADSIFGNNNDRCLSEIKNKRHPSIVVDTFSSLLKHHHFVGQDEAIKIVKDRISDYIFLKSENEKFINPKILSFHFVGPTGSGKSLMAEIIGKSFYNQYECPKYFSFLSKTDLCQYFGKRYQSWQLACGIVRGAFLQGEHDKGLDKMKSILHRAAEILKFNDNEGIIIVFDDFNFCSGLCPKQLQDLFETKTIATKNGERVNASNVILIFTSDLTAEGIVLPNGIRDRNDFINARNKVLQATNRFWGDEQYKSKYFLQTSIVIPFVQLNSTEMHDLLVYELERFGNAVNKRIEFEIRSHENKINWTSFYTDSLANVYLFLHGKGMKSKWQGKLIYDKDFVDMLSKEIDVLGNGRDITLNIGRKLDQLLMSPFSIGEEFIKNAKVQVEHHMKLYMNNITLKLRPVAEKRNFNETQSILEYAYLEVASYP